MRLPRAYTDLHSEVSSIAGPECSHPAVCLVCGDVLDANGGGRCTQHAQACGGGVGLVFLLQVRACFRGLGGGGVMWWLLTCSTLDYICFWLGKDVGGGGVT